MLHKTRILVATLSLAAVIGCAGGSSSDSAGGADGKADGASECYFGDTYWDSIESGKLTETASKTYWSADETLIDGPSSDTKLGAQIVAAAEASTGEQYTSVAAVFEASEASELTVVELRAEDGKTFRAVRFYPGGNAYGAFFAAGSTETAAVFGDDDITECAPVATCSFGTTYWDSIESGAIDETGSTTYWNADEILADGTAQTSALLGKQIVAAAEAATGEDYNAVADVFAASEASELTVVELKADDGRRFRAIRFYPGGNAYGAIFTAGTIDTAAVFGDDDITACYE